MVSTYVSSNIQEGPTLLTYNFGFSIVDSFL